MLGRLRNSFAEVDLGALEHNFHALSALSLPLCPMVKADGYGHGDIQVARVCERLGARSLGVALIEEGIRLRLAGIQSQILVFSHFDSLGAEAIVKYRLTPVVCQFEQLEKLKTSLHESAAYPVHIKFNTGMQRLGFEPEDAPKLAALFESETYFKLEGVCTHLVEASDFNEPSGHTQIQIQLMTRIKEVIKAKVQSQVLFHYQNSSALISQVKPAFDMARPGIAIYGYLPKLSKNSDISLKPVMSVKSFVAFIHKVKKGATASYGGTWKATKDSVIAVVPIGYADGLPRLLSNKGKVLIGGMFCPVAGIVTMDSTMVDVTDLVQNKSLALGDEVVLIGTQKELAISAADIAELTGTISYEILTGMQSRLARVYLH